MKKIFLISVLLVVLLNAKGQNLVPNPSFEVYDTCPNNSSQIQFATGWSSFRNSPDYFNTCSTGVVSIPNNQIGYQQPLAGNAYSGLLAYSTSTFYREIMGAQLTAPLIIGQKYFVSLEVVLSNNLYGDCGIDKIGAKFSTIPYSYSHPGLINNSAQVYSSSIITDTLNWTKIKSSFIADSAYSFIMLGNFFNDANTDTTQTWGNSSCTAYYMIDNVCVSTDSIYAYNYVWTGIEEKIFPTTVSIYPNPATSFINIDFPILNDVYTVTIYDVLGREIFFKEKIIEQIEPIPIANINSNILFIQIKYKNKIINYKLIKIK